VSHIDASFLEMTGVGRQTRRAAAGQRLIMRLTLSQTHIY
jgi:hypothetical protein